MATTSARMLINQGGASFAAGRGAGRGLSRRPMASTSRCRCSISTGSTASSPASISATVALLQQAGRPTWSASACRAPPAGADLPHPRLGPRHRPSASSPRPANTAGSTRCCRRHLLPRHDGAALPDGADHRLLLVFQLNVSEIGSFFSPQYGGAPWSLGEVRRSRRARLAGRRHRHLRRPRLQHARHARQSARRAQRPICRDGARQGPARQRRDHAPCRAQCAASADHLSGRRAALHADRRDRDRRSSSRLADRRPGHRRLDGGRRRLCHRHLHAGAGGHADRRQHHRRHAAGRCSIPRVRLGEGTANERPSITRSIHSAAARSPAAPPTPCRRGRQRRRDRSRTATRAISPSSGAASAARPWA